MPVARTYRRALAHLIDAIILSLLFLPVWIQVFASLVQSRGLTVDVSLTLLVTCFFVQFLYRWLFLRLLGGTIGKLIMGLRVVNKNDGKELSLIQSFLRVATDQMTLFFGPAHWFLIFARFDRTHLADWVAETQVRQTSPREDHPRRNIPVTFVLCLFFAVRGFQQAYFLVQRTEVEQGKVLVQLFAGRHDNPTSGHRTK